MAVCIPHEERTAELLAWAQAIASAGAQAVAGAGARTPFDAARELAARLGAHYVDGAAEVGFWAPELAAANVPGERIFLEVFTPLDALDFTAAAQGVRFRRERVPLRRQGAFAWGVVTGLIPGTRTRVGSFYRLAWQEGAGAWLTLPDVLACSVPFGIFAPAEFYDMAALDQDRADRDYFATLDRAGQRDGLPVIPPPVNILQAHVQTATEAGSLAGLARFYQRLGRKVEAGEPLTPAEEVFAGYDALELLPLEPVPEPEQGDPFWRVVAEDGDTVTVALTRPATLNWGYDTMIVAASTVNPALLETGRPDELADLAAALHNFPARPLRLILDIAFSHAHHQAAHLLGGHYFNHAPNMYGLSLDIDNPTVRAILLEMQRRKAGFGIDGFRVDSSHDFLSHDPANNWYTYDDDYLLHMRDTPATCAGWDYYPLMFYEDSRPEHPPRGQREGDNRREDTLREVIDRQPEAFQWGPSILGRPSSRLRADFWRRDYDRMQRIAREGANWITGCDTHDTVRHATREAYLPGSVHTTRGADWPGIFRLSYDNPASTLLWYALLPGVPMDYLNARARAPWIFYRSHDDAYAPFVAAQEMAFFDWQVGDALYADPANFRRLKALGYGTRRELCEYLLALDAIKDSAPPHDDAPLRAFAAAWAQDVNALCSVPKYAAALDPAHTGAMLAAREFRRARPWLRGVLRRGEKFLRLEEVEEADVYCGFRLDPAHPDGPFAAEHILFVANMAGQAVTVIPAELPCIPPWAADDSRAWEVALATPGLEAGNATSALTLRDSEGVVFLR